MNKANESIFDIYQIKHGSAFRDYGFENLESLEARGLKVEYKNYEFIYSGKMNADMNLENIFAKFNMDRPEDFRGHSLSVSDVIVIEMNGKATAHFVDSFGFKEIPEFVRDREEARKSRTSVMDVLKENKAASDKGRASSKKNKHSEMDER